MGMESTAGWWTYVSKEGVVLGGAMVGRISVAVDLSILAEIASRKERSGMCKSAKGGARRNIRILDIRGCFMIGPA